MSSFPLFDITRFTLLDYPDKLASILWFSGCNMRCQYCYNGDIVLGNGRITEEELFEFLHCRIGKLDAVVLSGGEATLYPQLLELCKKIKSLGFLIKLDTNGLNTAIIQKLLDAQLLDYVALDYKAPKHLFELITKNTQWKAFNNTLNLLLKEKHITLEIRTTLHSALLNEKDVLMITDDLVNRGYTGTYYLQNFFRDVPTLNNLLSQKKIINCDIIQSHTKNCLNIEYRNF
jgi:pyruvate formate lyase activating enzyme